ncbi:MAG: hypothetical protein K2X27_22065 [Candidatus Obscuribacterales bacterium]|nr:hypothetical protein [Candidatus Obscuribacterales bacterium]
MKETRKYNLLMWSGLRLNSRWQNCFKEPVEETGIYEVLFNYESSLEFTDYDSYVLEAHEQASISLLCWESTLSKLKILSSPWAPDYEKIELNRLVELVYSVPDPSLFQRIVILDYPHPDQAWLDRESPGLVLEKELRDACEVILYRPKQDMPTAEGLVFSCFARLLKEASPQESALFDKICEAKTLTFFSRTGGGEWTSAQIWVDLLNLMLRQSKIESEMTAHFDAVAAVVVASALRRRMRDLPAALCSDAQQKYLDLLNYVNDELVDLALSRMEESGDCAPELCAEFRTFVKSAYPGCGVN